MNVTPRARLPALGQPRGRQAASRHREGARRPTAKVGSGAGERWRLGRLVDGEGEALGSGHHAVGGGEVQGVGTARPRRRGAAEHAGGRLNVTPAGSVSLLLSLSVGVGTPLAVTVKLPACPTAKVVLLAMVKAGAGSPG